MPSIAIKPRLAAWALVAACAGASAVETNRAPTAVADPLLGLKLPLKNLALDPFPDNIVALCPQLADDGVMASKEWIFGQVKTPNGEYYLINGYGKRHRPQPGQALYSVPDDGGLFKVADGKCGGDAARETYAVRDADQIPLDVLKALARDEAMRLEHAFGGADGLRAAIRKQRIDFKRLGPDVQEAFAPYFKPAQSKPAK